MNNLLENLNKEQLEAVMHKDGPLLIIAGAGTGKTTIITQRIAYLIEQGLAKSEEILALTFTEKAAGEMDDRVNALLPIGYSDLWISTFHSFGERILKEEGLAIGLPTDFKLLNEFEQWILIKKNLDKFNLDYYRPMGNPTKFIHALVKHFSRAKDEDISPKEYLKYAEGLKENLDGMLSGSKSKRKISNISLGLSSGRRQFPIKIQNPKLNSIPEIEPLNREIAEQEVLRINEVANAYHVYQQLLLDNNALDFGDLINYCVRLFCERPAVLAKYRSQFKYILLDEFQDTNWAQYELVKILASPKNNLVVVGDDDQSIYKFRGASVSNILQFKKDYPESREIVLVKNYRNTQNILDLSYDFIKINDPNRLEWQLNRGRTADGGKQKKDGKIKRYGETDVETQASLHDVKTLSKKLIADNKSKGMIEVIEGQDLDEEVRMVVEKIAELKIADKTCSWNDFAILVRANESAKDFINALDAAGLPYVYLSSRGLYSKPVIMDVIAYLKLLDNYHESACLYRILNLPIFNFSYQELVNFNYWASKKAWSLYEVLKSVSALHLSPEIQSKVDKVLALIAKHTALVRDRQVSEVLISFLTDSGYLKYLTSQDERLSREATGYLNQFLKRIKAFASSSDEKNVKAFLEELNLEIDAGEQGGLAPDFESGPDAIKVMTVHSAKGLEFKYVFIVNMVDKRFPTIERREPIAVPDALVKEILPAGDIHKEEERRLLYVAMTRAKDHLYFSWSPDYGGVRKKKPSEFLFEAKLLENKNLPKTSEKGVKELQISNIPAYTPAFAEASDNKKASADVETLADKSAGKQNSGLRPSLRRGFGWQEGYGGQAKSKTGDNKEADNIKLPNYFSYTQLAAFNNCPYQYRFAHLLRVPILGKPQFSFGKTMHSVMQKTFELVNEKKSLGQGNLFGNKKKSTDDKDAKSETPAVDIDFNEILKLYEASWIDDWYKSKKEKADYKKLGEKILAVFHAKYNKNWPKTLFLEKSFNIKIKAGSEIYTVRGIIDRIDEIGGKIKIVDYKTGSPKDNLSFENKEQLLIYQIAARDLFKERVGALVYYYLENNTEEEFLGSDDDLIKINDKIITTIKAIGQSDFRAKPSKLCRFCDYFHICEFRATL